MDAEVILVGGGPAGLMLAHELGRRGISVLLLEEDTGTAVNPQANATQARSMEHYRRLGFVDAVRARGLPPTYPTDIAYFTRYTTHEIARFPLPPSGIAKDVVRGLSGSWSAAELPHRVSQMFVEQVMHREAEKLSGVTLLHGWRVSAVADHGTHVEVTAGDGHTERGFTATYVVGCDGARSIIRQALDIQYEGDSGAVRDFMGGRMHAIYFRLPNFYDIVPHAPAWMYWAFNPQRRSFMAAVDGKQQFVAHTQLRPHDPQEPTRAEARRMVHELFGAEVDIEVFDNSSWTAGFALVANSYGSGRILLAGDAVHLFTPAGGLGYNTAVEDAVNLGWKLAATLRGWGGPGLLASYQIERQPVARRNTFYARGFADSIGLFAPAPEIEDATPEGAAARAAAGTYLNAHARAEFDIPGVTFGARFDGSPILLPDGTVPPPDAANSYTPTACPGGRAPHAWMPDGASLYDRFGFDFTLLRLGHHAEDGTALAAEATKRGIPLKIVDLADDALRDLYEADLALIRPDQVVAWRGNALPDPAMLLARVTGF